LRPDPPVQTLWWCSRWGMSWRAARAAHTCPDGCAPMAGAPRRGHQSWLRHRQLVIGERSPEYQALRSAGLAGAGTATPRINHPCPGREWGRRYHAWRHNLHRWAAIDLAVFAPTFPEGKGSRSWSQGRSRSCPPPLRHPNSRPRRLTSILCGCGDKPRPTAHGLGGGGLCGGPGFGGRGMWPPGHPPCQGCLCDAGEPPLPGLLDEG